MSDFSLVPERNKRSSKLAQMRLFNEALDNDRRAAKAAMRYARLAAQVESYLRPPKYLVDQRDEAYDEMVSLSDFAQGKRREARSLPIVLAA